MNRLAITNYVNNCKTYVACSMLDENRKVIDFAIYPKEEQDLLNAIFVARVENIVPSINAAFVKISPSQTCYLPLEDSRSVIYTAKRAKSMDACIGDELLVQVVREGVKTKDPIASTKLTLSGSYAVLTTENKTIGISNKIDAQKKEELREVVTEVLPPVEERSYGVVIRTMAATVSKGELILDIKNLVKEFEQLLNNSMHASIYTRCHQPAPAFLSYVKGLRLDLVDQIITDDTEIFELLQQSFSNLQDMLVWYDDPSLSLNRLYKIETTIEDLLGKKVWLKSGANIIIEQLETLTFIDVNTAKNQSKKAQTLLNVNKEAAKEAIRQIRLRNISGMILIDFINMNKEEEEELAGYIKTELSKESIPFHFIDVTQLGLVEMTRKKVKKSLLEVVKKPVDLP